MHNLKLPGRLVSASLAALLTALTISCTSGGGASSAPAANPSVAPAGRSAAPKPKRADENVVEETDAYYVERFKKSEMVKIDDTHVGVPIMPRSKFAIYREDADYYYIRFEKWTPEEIEASRKKSGAKAEQKKMLAATIEGKPVIYDPKDFAAIPPVVGKRSIRLTNVDSGLPARGQFRANVAVADVDGDGKLDIVTTVPRQQSGPTFRIFLGDGAGKFREQKPKVVDAAGNDAHIPGIYGGVTVADFNGDGRPDVAVVSHSGGLHVYLAKGNFVYEDASAGLPVTGFSGQAVAAVDVNGDGHPDLVVSQDAITRRTARDLDHHQVRLFLNQPGHEWKELSDGVIDGSFSMKLRAFDPDGDGSIGFVTGSNVYFGTNLVWRLRSPGLFQVEPLDEMVPYSYHLGVAPGHFGPSRVPAVAAFFGREAAKLELKAEGVVVYAHESGAWKRHIVFQETNFAGNKFTTVGMGDLNGDGLDDVIFPDTGVHRLRIFLQTAAGSFEEIPAADEPALDSTVSDIVIADFNGDGKPDILLAKATSSKEKEEHGGLQLLINGGPK